MPLVPYPAPSPLAGDRTWSIYDVARKLGLYSRPHCVERRKLKSPPVIVAHIAALVDNFGFPLPYPTIRGGVPIVGVTRDSRWPESAIASWFDDRLPPDTLAAIDGVAMAAAADDMDARACHLRLVA